MPTTSKKPRKPARSKSALPRYIADWHEYIDREPEKHGQDIRKLKGLVEKIFDKKDVRYDPAPVDRFIHFARTMRHKEGRWAGQPLELSIEQKYFVACILGLKIRDKELKQEVRYFREAILLVARKFGKALALDTPVNTPDGWSTIGGIQVGDFVYDDQGKPTRILDKSEVFVGHDCYEVTFEDGEKIIADADHLWTVTTKNARRMIKRPLISDRKLLRPDYRDGNGYFTMTTADMAGDFMHKRRDGKGIEYKYRVPMPKPLEGKDGMLPLDPYVLGLWLGDGAKGYQGITCSCDDTPEVIKHVNDKGIRVKISKDSGGNNFLRLGEVIYCKGPTNRGINTVRENLKDLNLIGNKHIPECYLRASEAQRWELLRGIMDTDGFVDAKTHACEFVQKDRKVCDGFNELLASLAIKFCYVEKVPTCKGQKCDSVLLFKFITDKQRNCFKLSRKTNRLKEHLAPRMLAKSIIDIKKADSVPTQCIAVDNPKGLFLIGKRNTVTHNSTFISAIASYMLLSDREAAPQVWTLATQKTQAAIVYKNARDMLLTSEVLTPRDRPGLIWYTRRDTDNCEMIVSPINKGYMKPGSKNSKGQDGLNPHCFIIDELHAITDRNTYDVFSSAQGARTQPLSVIISTFGFVREGIFDSVYERCRKVLDGKTRGARIFPMIFRIDDEDDPDNRACWIKANPGIPEARPTVAYLEGEYQKALDDPAQMPSFLAKHLNRATNQADSYFKDQATIDNCAVDIKTEDYQDKYGVGGVDLAETTDLCCASALIPIGGKLKLIQKYFVASARIEQNSKSDKMAYRSFTSTNAEDPNCKELLQICDGPMVRKSEVTLWYRELSDKYGITFWSIAYDRWHGGDWSDEMEQYGFPKQNAEGMGCTYPVAMGAKSLSSPMKELKAVMENRGLEYDRHNGLFRWCCSNVAVVADANNNIRPEKARSRSRIDGFMSALLAYIAYKQKKNLFDEYQP